MESEIGPVVWVTSESDRRHLLEVLRGSEVISLDLETTGLREHAVRGGHLNGGYPAEVVLASFTLPSGGDLVTWLLPLSHPESPFLGTWRKVLQGACESILEGGAALVGQNLKFDLRWLYALTQVDLAHLLAWDTVVSSHLMDENESTRLKERAPITLGVKRWDEDIDLSYPGAAKEHPLMVLGDYAARDTYYTLLLAQEHQRQMYLHPLGSDEPDPGEPEFSDDVSNARLGSLATWAAMPAVASLTKIEQRGFTLDVDWVRAELKYNLSQREELLEQMRNRYSTDPDLAPSSAATSRWFEAWTRAAVEAGDLQITAMTKTGKPQWSKAVLTRQARSGSEAAKMVLDQRMHGKRAEYLSSWLDHMSPQGVIHTNYNAGRVATGRLSSNGPNMQQITAELRPAFIPRPGYVIVDIDYSQIELRAAAFISRCEPMIEALQRGDDLHRLLAARITGKDPQDVSPGERQAGKSANFGLLYSMGPFGFMQYAQDAYDVILTEEEAQTIHAAFFEMWDGMGQWHERVRRRVNAEAQVVSPLGRVRRLPQIHDGHEATAAFAERAAINSPVQGFASDLMQIAGASIQGLLPGIGPVAGAYPVATVHDSIVMEVREDHWEEITRECIDRMVNLGEVLEQMDCLLDVPLAAEAKVGTRWGLADVGEL